MATSQQTLLEAVNALYKHPDEKVKKQADAWLEGWQQSLEAWSISDAVLHDKSAPLEAKYIAAQTLRTKVRRDFEELPVDAIPRLRDSIVELLMQYASSIPPVRVQLSLALAAMAAHVPGSQWGQGGIVHWLTTRLESMPADVSLPCMLQLLEVLPEEASSYSPAVRPERRRQLTEEMIASGPMALQVLASCLNQPSENTRSWVLRVFASWLKLTPGGGLPGAQLAQHPLVTATLEGLNATDTFDGAVEVMVELIYSTSSRGAPDEGSLALVARLVPAVLALVPRFATASRVAQAEHEGRPADSIPGANEEDDEDVVKGMARLFAELGESFVAMIASGSQDAIKPVEALLEVAGYPDDSICSMSFDFWHRLGRLLHSNFSLPSTSSQQEAAAASQRRKEAFYPPYTRLVSLIRGRVRYPNDYDTLHPNDQAEFKRARYAVGDTLLDAAVVLGAERILQLLIEPLQEVSQRVQAGGEFDWRTAEAALFCIRSVSKVASIPDNPMLLALFQGLPQLPAVPTLQHTAALTVGNYAEWLAAALKSGKLQDLVPQLLQMLTSALGHADTASAAALAFRDLCEACGQQLGPYLEALMQLYQRVQSSGAATSAMGAGGLALDEDDVQQIMEAVARIVSTLPADQRRAALGAMLLPVVHPLQQALAQSQSNGGNSTHAAAQASEATVLPLFDRLTIIFRRAPYVADPSAVADALLQAWPMLETALLRYISNAGAVERLCRAPRYALKTAGKLAATGPLVTTLMTSLPRWFAAAQHSCFLYLGSELVKIFGDVPRQEGALGDVLAQLLEQACQGLKRLRQFDEHPDVADDTFLLATRALSYCAKLVVTARLVPVLLDSVQAGLLVQHREACLSVLTFLARLFDDSTKERISREAATQLQADFAPRAPVIFRLLIAGATGALPASRVMDISETLIKVLKATREPGLQWFSDAVNCLPNEAATTADRQHLLSVAAAAASADDGKSIAGRMDEAMEDLSELVRRNRHAQEAAQKALLPAELRQMLL